MRHVASYKSSCAPRTALSSQAYGHPIPGKLLARHAADLAQECTQRAKHRPLGCSAFLVYSDATMTAADISGTHTAAVASGDNGGGSGGGRSGDSVTADTGGNSDGVGGNSGYAMAAAIGGGGSSGDGTGGKSDPLEAVNTDGGESDGGGGGRSGSDDGSVGLTRVDPTGQAFDLWAGTAGRGMGVASNWLQSR